MKKLKIILLISPFLLISFYTFSQKDSLIVNKIAINPSLYGGVSFGKNNLTYSIGGRYALGVDCSFEKNNYLFGIDALSTNFRDRNFPYEKHGFIFTQLATHIVNNYSLYAGKKIGKYKKSSLTIGVGYQTYRQPIIEKNVSMVLHLSDIKLKGSTLYQSMTLNTKLRSSIKNGKLLNVYGVTKISMSPKITYLTLAIGIEPKLKKIKIFA